MQTYIIGRGKKADITLIDADNSVSKCHAELVKDSENNLYLTDCGSLNGTFLWKDGNWVRIKQTYIDAHSIIRLGTHYQVRMQELLNFIETGMLLDNMQHSIMRNPETGEILKRG
jgi:pSer/pThr/pTyr-binding forkhead associated (FHA) protein